MTTSHPIAALALAGLLVACSKPEPPAPSVPDPTVAGEVVTFPGNQDPATLRIGTVASPSQHPVLLPGRLAWDEDHTARIYAPYAGRIERLLVAVGDRVKRGQPLAVLAGDALIISAFETIAMRSAAQPQSIALLMRIVGGAVGSRGGIVAGQAWECEPKVDVAMYHRSKTGALFAGAAAAGAAAMGADPEKWRPLGAKLGEAYQVADDIGDAVAENDELGKPTHQDEALGRPNAVRELGLDGALARLRSLAPEAVAAIPPCPGAAELQSIILSESKRLVPRSLAVRAA